MNEKLQAILEMLETLDWQERELLFDKLKEVYCIHCGVKQPEKGQRCQCWNDE